MILQVQLSFLLTPYVPFSSCFAGFLGCFSAAESLHNEHSGEVDVDHIHVLDIFGFCFCITSFLGF